MKLQRYSKKSIFRISIIILLALALSNLAFSEDISNDAVGCCLNPVSNIFCNGQNPASLLTINDCCNDDTITPYDNGVNSIQELENYVPDRKEDCLLKTDQYGNKFFRVGKFCTANSNTQNQNVEICV